MKTETFLNDNWQFRQAGEEQWLSARVPGQVHLDLLDHKLIDDPYWRDNESIQQWIGEKDWEYQTQFLVTESQAVMAGELHFDGLDTYADVYINDALVLSADNMYCGWQTDIAPYLNAGSNTLRIYFHSAITQTQPLYEANRFTYPANTSQPEPKLSVYSRKPGYHFGWDWGPRLVTCGIWRPVKLVFWERARIIDAQFVQNTLDSMLADLTLRCTLKNCSSASPTAALSVRLSDRQKSFSPVVVALEHGVSEFDIDFAIEQPQLWWTHGLGEQPLYELTLALFENDVLVDQWQHRVGLRTIELIHEDDEHGKCFYFKLNGEPLYIKGSNCIPADFFVPRLKESDYRQMLSYALDANMNMLRLWGGAIYEEKMFYDLCDEKGILVWQDFMFACAAYPCDDTMAARIEQEAEYNVKRIRNHASLALWCGNNEIAEGWHTWGWQKRYNYSEETCELVWSYYERIFHQILPQAVEHFDAGRPYWASSPKYGFVDERAKVDGDMHYWGVWFLGHRREQFIEYLPRFMSEYGLQSMPELKTFEAFSEPKDWDITSKVMITHQKQYANPSKNQFLDGYGMMIQYLEREYVVPEDFEQLAYMTQLLQADYLGFAIKAHRFNQPYCMGTMYWQLNDMWPVTSWASVDYFGRWKASHYAIRDTYKPLAVMISQDKDSLVIGLVSDALTQTQCCAELSLLGFDGEEHYAQSLDVCAKANGATSVAMLDRKRLLEKCNSRRVVLVARCRVGNVVVSTDLFYFHHNNELEFVEPNLQIAIENSGTEYELVIKSDELVKNLFLKTDTILEHNYVDVLPGQPLRLKLPSNLDYLPSYIHYQMCL